MKLPTRKTHPELELPLLILLYLVGVINGMLVVWMVR